MTAVLERRWPMLSMYTWGYVCVKGSGCWRRIDKTHRWLPWAGIRGKAVPRWNAGRGSEPQQDLCPRLSAQYACPHHGPEMLSTGRTCCPFLLAWMSPRCWLEGSWALQAEAPEPGAQNEIVTVPHLDVEKEEAFSPFSLLRGQVELCDRCSGLTLGVR